MTCASAPVGPIIVDDMAGSWESALTGLTEYWAGALRRHATPVEVVVDACRWWRTATRRERPSWSTPNEVVWEAGVARLRDFSQGSRARVVPTLVLPPQAGHDSCIVDYNAQQSQMQTIRAAGLPRVFTLDWIGARTETKDAGIADYLAVVGRAVDDLGGHVNLVGDCQGGWLATMFAALAPDAVNTLTIAGAPIDFHAGEPVIHRWVESCTPGGSLALYETLVAAGGGVLRGEEMIRGFIALRPQNEVERQITLLANIHDEEHVRRYREFEDWFKHTQDIPGRFYLWIVEKLFRDNLLIKERIEVDGRRLRLSEIAVPLYLLAGETDHITPPAQVFELAEHASTPPAQVTRRIAPGGHLGLFMGHASLRDHWTPLMAQVAERSQLRPRRPRAVKAS